MTGANEERKYGGHERSSERMRRKKLNATGTLNIKGIFVSSLRNHKKKSGSTFWGIN